MDTRADAEIKAELDRLGKPEWQQIIDALTTNFKGYPFDDPETQSPAPAIYQILKEITPGDLPESTDEAFIRHLSRADIFSFRAYRNTQEGPVYWEPLKERLVDFNRGENTTKYQSEHEYPSPDVIRGWYYHKLSTIRQ